jgi:hypothetical protein
VAGIESGTMGTDAGKSSFDDFFYLSPNGDFSLIGNVPARVASLCGT